MKRVLIGLVVFVVAIASYWLLSGDADDNRTSNDRRSGGSIAVEVEPWERTSIRDVRRFTGTLFAADEFTVAPKISGRVDRIFVDIGDTVEKGQLIAQLEDAEAEQALQQAQAEIDVAEARLNQARSDYDLAQREFARFDALRERGLSTDAEIDTSEAAMRAAQASVALSEAQLRQQQASLRAAEVRLSYTQIRADWDNGDTERVIGERFVNPGSTVAANTPLLSILSIERLKGVFFVPESAYPLLRTGQAVDIRPDALPDETFTGTVRRIAPLFQESSRQARVEAQIDNEKLLLKPGMFVTVSVEVDSADNALVVPSRALVRRQGEQGVFIAEGEPSVARFIAVSTGIEDGQRIQITSPEELDGPVVVLGQQLLDDDVSLTVVEDVNNTAGGA